MAASAAGILADNPNGNKIFLANRVSTLFIKSKLALINGLAKLKNLHLG